MNRGANPKRSQSKQHLYYALIFSNVLSLFFYLIRVISTNDTIYWFLIWNLFLAWLPLLFALWLQKRLKLSKWLSSGNIILTILWLGFLPNSFYLLSDLIHLQNTGEIGILFDAALFAIFIFNGFFAGFASLYIIHRELIKRIIRHQAHIIIILVILLSSFAIYLGRSLRWNTWDVVFNPAELLYDVSVRIIDPTAYPQAILTTGSFFLLLSSMYGVIWECIGSLRKD